MDNKEFEKFWHAIRLQYKAHPWHGIPIGDECPEVVTSFVEITPTDTVKYEVDKDSGYLKIDRPQKFSNIVPALYGFVPQTYCKEEVAQYCMDQIDREGIVGDGDPLDICILSERNIVHGNIIVKARPIGGFRLLDGGEADDKIISILHEDEVFGQWEEITDRPESLKNRLLHYFLTYKKKPFSEEEDKIEIVDVYGREEAYEVIRRSRKDYTTHFSKSMEQSMRDSFRHLFEDL